MLDNFLLEGYENAGEFIYCWKYNYRFDLSRCWHFNKNTEITTSDGTSSNEGYLTGVTFNGRYIRCICSNNCVIPRY